MKTIFSLILVVGFGYFFYEKAKTLELIKFSELSEVVNEHTGGGSVTEDKTNGDEPKQPIQHSQETINYFNTICRGFEYGSGNQISKWESDVKVFVKGERPTYLMSELKSIVNELNSYIDPIEIDFVNSESDANFIVFIGSANDYIVEEPYAADLVDDNWGLFVIYGSTIIKKATMYVDTKRCTDIDGQKHLLREEFTQALGFKKDSYDYPNSMFYQGWTTTTEYAPIDVEIIKMLYNE